MNTADAATADLVQFLKFASVSTDPAFAPQVNACADWLVAKLAAAGLTVEKHATPGHPVVVARNAARAGRPTVLIYGHYDVQPADPLDLWKTPPFEPRIEDGVIYARGSTDNKGQILAHILGIQEALAEDGDLPVNVILLIEGEEEIGSSNLEDFLVTHCEELRCDIAAVSDTGMVAKGWPTYTYGLRGIMALELRVSGPSVDLHSGIYGGTVANPATALARLLATLHDDHGHVAIAGFYDDVLPVQDWERTAWSKLPRGDEELLTLTGSPSLFGEAGFTSIERSSARPTAEINGFGSGYQGDGTKTIIPSKAMAKLTFRLVPGQDPKRIEQLTREHLQRHLPPGVTLEIKGGHAGEPYLADPNSAAGQAAQRALRTTFAAEPALIREGGSIPIVQTFKDVLGVETLLLGLALPDARAHSPNENFPLENLRAGSTLNRNLLRELAAVQFANSKQGEEDPNEAAR
jgi:acetylornithine deacetylase/succinyl-diaminopimelate desuccinylase-like protein